MKRLLFPAWVWLVAVIGLAAPHCVRGAETAGGTFQATIDVFGQRNVSIDWSGSWSNGIFSASMTMTQDGIGNGAYVTGHMQIASSNPAQSRALTVTSPTGGAPSANGSWSITALPIVVSMWLRNESNGSVTQQQVVATFDGEEECPDMPFVYWIDNRFGLQPKQIRLIAYVTGLEYEPIAFLGEHTVQPGFAFKKEGVVQMCPGQALHLEVWNGTSWEGYSPAQGDPPPTPGDARRLTVSIPGNSSSVTITFRIMKTLGGVTTLHSQYVQAPGASGVIQVLTVPNDGATYEVVSRVEGFEFVDGQWVVAEGAIKEQSVSPPVSTSELPVPEDPTGEPVEVSTPTDVPTSGPATESSGGTAWRSGSTGTAATDALTNTVYREGVEKILAMARVSVAPTMHSGDVAAPPKAAVNPLRKVGSSKIPSAPSFFTDAFPTNVSSISYTSQPITVGGRTMPGKTITYDLADHAVPVAAFRAICSGVLWVNFFFLVVWTVRGAGAGK